jgi:hypothetical protein
MNEILPMSSFATKKVSKGWSQVWNIKLESCIVNRNGSNGWDIGKMK